MRKVTPFGLVFFLLLASSSAFGQSNYANLSGTVFDPQQQAVPGAAIQLTSDSTGASRQVTSNEQGVFQVTGVLPGAYKLTVQAAGFAPLTHLKRDVLGQRCE